MSVVARFYVATVSRHAGGSNGEVIMRPVSRGPENKKWASATPSGEFKMSISNPDALAFFDNALGKDVAITIELRPMVCTECHEEITNDQYGTNTVADDEGDAKHRVCPKDQPTG
jgi:hypothetical protein